MKILVCAVFVFAAVAAEPPRYRSARFRPEQDSEGVPASRRNDGAPYPASGFRPPTEFALPARQEVVPARQEVVPPSTSYGVPDSNGASFFTYLVPRSMSTEYGPPSEKSEGGEEKKEDKKEGGEEKKGEEREGGKKNGEVEELTEGGNKEGGENREEKEGGENREEKKGYHQGEREERKKRPEVITTGAYYILLPDSQLQRVQFRTEDDLANMAYSARLQYSNEGRAPVYVYSAVPVPEYGAPASAPYVQWY